MDYDGVMSDQYSEATGLQRQRPHASAWLWRPWYAKLWWGLIALYWAAELGSIWVPAFASFFTKPAAGLLNIIFYPLTALMLLGFGYLRAWMDSKEWKWGPPMEGESLPERSIGGWSDPASDPIDPRSGSLWINSPENQAKLFNLKGPSAV